MKTLLLLLKGGMLKPILLTLSTMVLSIGVYSLQYGWKFALGFVLLILIHELGHFVAARQSNVDVGAPTFIPFVGAYIELKDKNLSPEVEAHIAFNGPLAGSVASLVCYYCAEYFDSGLLYSLAYSGFFLNLINLIPIVPFDGGRITQIISNRIWILGVPLLIVVFYYTKSPLFMIIGFSAVPHALRAWKSKPSNDTNIEPNKKILYGTYYLGLLIFLGSITFSLHEALSHR